MAGRGRVFGRMRLICRTVTLTGRGRPMAGTLNSSRGAWQLVPGTFRDTTSRGRRTTSGIRLLMVASMNYQMSRYGVAHDGHNEGGWLGRPTPVSTTAIRGEHDALC